MNNTKRKDIEKKTAILLFTLSPQQEARRKSFVKTRKQANQQIAAHLVQYAQQQARQTGFSLYTAYGEQQVGHSFGERLANEADRLFSMGFEKLIIIGNDCLELDSQLMLEANQQCNPSNLVLGPARDGGLYLLGLHRSQFKKKQFANLDWEQASLQQSLFQYADSILANTYQLATYDDIDDSNDFYQILKSIPVAHPLQVLFIHLLERIERITFSIIYFFKQVTTTPYFNLRAPPTLL